MSHVLKRHSVTPSLSAGELSLHPNFQKGGGLDRTSTFRGGLLGKRGMTFFKGGWTVCRFIRGVGLTRKKEVVFLRGRLIPQ